ncbi:uncharacterized protein LOC144945741 [Lampetra fluviatilis]
MEQPPQTLIANPEIGRVSGGRIVKMYFIGAVLSALALVLVFADKMSSAAAEDVEEEDMEEQELQQQHHHHQYHDNDHHQQQHHQQQEQQQLESEADPCCQAELMSKLTSSSHQETRSERCLAA